MASVPAAPRLTSLGAQHAAGVPRAGTMPLIRLLRALWFRTGTCLPGTAKPPSASTARVNALAITADPSRTCSLRSGRRRDLRPDDEQHLPERVDPVPGTLLPGARQQAAERDRGGQPRRHVYPEDAPGHPECCTRTPSTGPAASATPPVPPQMPAARARAVGSAYRSAVSASETGTTASARPPPEIPPPQSAEPCARPSPRSRRQRTEPAHMRSPAACINPGGSRKY